MARASATLPRVEGPTNLQLTYSQAYLDHKKRRNPHKTFFGKILDLLNPRAWTLAYVVSATLLALALAAVWGAFRAQAALLKTTLFASEPLNQMMGYGLAECFGITLLVLHFTLNYRARSHGRIIKAYWYAGWALSVSFLFLPHVQGAFNRHHANRINEYCFASKKSESCTRALRIAHKSTPAQVLKLLPDNKKIWVAGQFKKLDPPLVELTEELKPAKTKGRRLASPVPLPR